VQLPVPSRLTTPPITVVATIAAPSTPSWLALGRIGLAVLAALLLVLYLSRFGATRTASA